MARDRKRAKQRQRRAQRQPARVAARREAAEAVRDAPPDAVARAPDDLELTEASERALVELDAPATALDAAPFPLQQEPLPEPGELEEHGRLDSDELEEAGAERTDGAGAAPGAAPPARPSGGRPRGGNRLVNFLRASWAELGRVQWPDRRQVVQATTVVLVFVLIAGAYLGVLDAIFSRLVNAIL
jgi:preprotein translocase SecE subunit